eukprot:gnl/TRDRNA2_/TRDRNA2_188520_c0_seq1.p1 gnl/TRDRNA2_/TRDRNA2_188520_c0~~gnl/TRDRNA2_/TRDRNA2_188520_c0_seq1.p1  ORF type:complete len:292 (+),score=40.01 gnl/TRDRNA2_/TRDRNA2_188520_c0_seq1:145-1020(+)
MPLDPSVAEELEVVLISPFDVHFSQTRIRGEFQDGHTLEETLKLIKGEPSRGSGKESQGDADEGGDDTGHGEEYTMLVVPFPPIEVTKWKCKLREPDGSPKIDPVTGLDLYSVEERWFTFDNRRLYCLQRAAAALWPADVRCEVLDVPQHLAKTRELRKFDTRTFGCSVLVGRRDDPEPLNWSWRTEVGLPEEMQPEGADTVARQSNPRRRAGGRGGGRGPNSGSGRGWGKRRNANYDDDEEDVEKNTCVDLLHNALLFFIVYIGLRLVASLLWYHMHGQPKQGQLPPAPG